MAMRHPFFCICAFVRKRGIKNRPSVCTSNERGGQLMTGFIYRQIDNGFCRATES